MGLRVEGAPAAAGMLSVSDKFPGAGVAGVFGGTRGTVWCVGDSDKFGAVRPGAFRGAMTDPMQREPVSDKFAAGA